MVCISAEEPCTTERGACVSVGDLIVELVSRGFEGPGFGLFASVKGGCFGTEGDSLFRNCGLVDSKSTTPREMVTLLEETSIPAALLANFFGTVVMGF